MIVEWVDSIRDPRGWDEVDAYLEGSGVHHGLVQSCGFLVGENEHYVMVALNTEREQWRAAMHMTDAMWIPKRAIDRITELSPR